MLLVSVRHKFRSANKIDRNPDKLTNRDAFMKRLTYSQRCDMTSGGLFAQFYVPRTTPLFWACQERGRPP